MQRLIKDCRARVVERVVVVDLSRLTRDEDSFWFFKFAEENDIEWCSITENFDTSTPSAGGL